MGWFDRPTSGTKVEALETVIGASTSVEGTIRSDGGVRIDGALEGAVDVAGNVVIGEGARVVADITARNLTVGGVLRGNVELAGQMQILSSGKVLGDVAVASLMIDDGGMFQGSSRLRGMDKAALPAPAEGAVTNHESTIHVEAVADTDTIDATSRPSESPAADGDVDVLVTEPATNQEETAPTAKGVTSSKTKPSTATSSKTKPSTATSTKAASTDVDSAKTKADAGAAASETASKTTSSKPTSSKPSSSAQTSKKQTSSKPTSSKPTSKKATTSKGAPAKAASTKTTVDEPDLDLNFDGLDIEPVIPDVVIEEVEEKPEPKPPTSSRKRGRRRNR